MVILIDVSGSMEGHNIQQAREAAMTAIEWIRDGARFAVLAGNDQASPVYPRQGLATASKRTRKDAKNGLRGLKAEGGTRIGTWLNAAADLLRTESGASQAILLSDGNNEDETVEALNQALSRASGVFQCECRAVGADWSVPELRRIAEALMGTIDIVAAPSGLAPDFEHVMIRGLGGSPPMSVFGSGRHRAPTSSSSSRWRPPCWTSSQPGQVRPRRSTTRLGHGETSPGTTTSACGCPLASPVTESKPAGLVRSSAV